MILGANSVISLYNPNGLIDLGNKMVELEDEKTILIPRSGLWTQQRSQQNSIGTRHGHKQKNAEPSFLIRALETIDVPAQS